MSNLMNLEFEEIACEDESLKEHAERMKSSIEKMRAEIMQKQTAIASLDASIASKNDSIDTLEKKQSQLMKANNSLKDHLVTQNKMLTASAKSLTPSNMKVRTSRKNLNKTPVHKSATMEVVGNVYKEEVKRVTEGLREALKKCCALGEDGSMDGMIRQVELKLKEARTVSNEIMEKNKALEATNHELKYFSLIMVRRKNEELSTETVKSKRQTVKIEKSYKISPALIKRIKSIAADLLTLKNTLNPMLKTTTSINAAMKGISW
eukprot:TRINITY_DN3581_c0_g1_i12.p1 TRINITY_DN3581_c0_g1~~TRINITY_DN3581_c0_g1_i12.p1  ORF type:complete len:264 (-),score=62.91 TRINITY_DN3581_c0_g1_i12:565-1356(-)